ncbi:unnamed protein product [Moneuplotes crassus]|uniref:Uncharacterized protein n=1 Tax=Euplotes crassus TaxID=5936 RepID=A0AAD1XSM2_EUPCR|nr:unnamed protein product [Moneuplotes crassus]
MDQQITAQEGEPKKEWLARSELCRGWLRNRGFRCWWDWVSGWLVGCGGSLEEMYGG